MLSWTANVFASDLGKAHAAGMNGHISKPVDIVHLIDVMKQWIK